MTMPPQTPAREPKQPQQPQIPSHIADRLEDEWRQMRESAQPRLQAAE